MNIVFQRNRNNSDDLMSQSEVNIQFLKDKPGKTLKIFREDKTADENDENKLFCRKIQ